jgi:hypothetical protein
VTAVTREEQHLRLLSIFHYVVAGITALFGCFPIFHLVIGLLLFFAPEVFDSKGEQPPDWIGLLFAGFALFIMMLFWILAAVILTAGYFLAGRTHYWFCLVVAGLECMFGPFGTVLGVFTIVVLMQDSVRQLFGVNGQRPFAPATTPFGPVKP